MTVYPVLHSGMNRMLAGHQSAPGRGTDRADVVSVQQQARVRQSIDVRRRNLTRSVKPDVVPSLFQRIPLRSLIEIPYLSRKKKLHLLFFARFSKLIERSIEDTENNRKRNLKENDILTMTFSDEKNSF